MTRWGWHRRIVLLLAACVLVAGVWVVGRSPATSKPARAAREETPRRLPPAANLKVRAGNASGDPSALRDPRAKGWEAAAPTRVLLNRTPRIYQTEKPNLGKPPALEVRALRAGDRVIFRLAWDDETKNAPEAPPKKAGTGGDPAKLYKRPTQHTTAFADAAAVMFPETWSGGEFPSLVMGDGKDPVRLYYWNASRGANQLTAAGRARVESAGKTFPHQAHHDGRRWQVTLELPPLPEGRPVAFAVWDGEAGDRDGMKWFSVWYVLE